MVHRGSMLSLILHLTANLAVLYQKYKAINGVKLKQLIFITQLRSVQKNPQQPKTKAEIGEKKKITVGIAIAVLVRGLGAHCPIITSKQREEN